MWRAMVRALQSARPGFDDELKQTYGGALTIVDFRSQLTQDEEWHDEIHPTEAAFQRLEMKLLGAVRDALPPEAKRQAFR